MKLIPILVCILFLIACGGNDPEPLVQRILEIKAFDVGNAGDGSDIRVNFNIELIAGINELRIMVIPSSMSTGFSKKQAIKLSSEHYTTEFRTTTNPDYSVRLSNELDVEGNPIDDTKEYIIKILMLGDKFNQLSIFQSNRLTLKERAIYEGSYKGVLTFNIDWDFKGFDPPEDNFTNSKIIQLQGEILTLNVLTQYEAENIFSWVVCGSAFSSGTIRFRNEEDGSLNFGFLNVEGATISETCFSSTMEYSSNLSDVYLECPGSGETGIIVGSVIDDLTLNFVGQECSAGQFKIELTRQFQSN